MRTRRAASGYGSGCRSTTLTKEKMAAFTPMPSASAAMATRVKRGFLMSARTAYRMELLHQSTLRPFACRCSQADEIPDAEADRRPDRDVPGPGQLRRPPDRE